MKRFSNYRNEQILLSKGSQDHIQSAYPDISMETVANCLANPYEVRKSTKKPKNEFYYLLRSRAKVHLGVLSSFARMATGFPQQ